MNYLKIFENFNSDEKIHTICKKHNIENYTINKDHSIDVDGDVYLYKKELTKIPLKFRKVSGDFSCYDKSTNFIRRCSNFSRWIFLLL